MRRLSTAFIEVGTKGIRPNSAANLFRHWVLFSEWPPRVLIPVEPISYILPTRAMPMFKTDNTHLKNHPMCKNNNGNGIWIEAFHKNNAVHSWVALISIQS